MNYQTFKRWFLLVFIGVFVTQFGYAQSEYHSYNDLTKLLKSLNNDHKDITKLTSVGKSAGGKDIWLLTIGEGDVDNNPAIAVIGGAKGSHLLGTELSLRFAQQLLSSSNDQEIKELVGSNTFYVFPQINPDASEQYFKKLTYERDGNNTSTDSDRDGYYDEDGYDDINGDNMITMMRVMDKTGDWTTLDKDSRIMVKADAKKNQMGMYHLYSEGKDDDSDGEFNEDGAGGVNINQNFSFDFPYFQPGSSENPVSESETRTVLDFLFEKALNTFAVISFGPANNLSTPMKFNRAVARKRVVSGWLSDDVAINKMISELYNKTTDLGKAPSGAPQKGDLFQWAYYHYGRFSFSTPGWWTPQVNDENGKAMKFSNSDLHFLSWAENENIDVFVEWEEIDHPDFPNQKVEVGGFKPYVKLNPPAEILDSLAESHTEFIIDIAEKSPRVKLENIKIESVGKNLTRITVDVYNEGLFPTASQLGQRNNWVRRVITQLKMDGSLEIVSGNVQSFDRSIPADGSVTKSWLVRGSGTATIRTGSPMTGFSTSKQTIK